VSISLHIVEPGQSREPGAMWRYLPGDIPGRESWWIVLPATHPDIGAPGHPSEISWRTTDEAADGSGLWAVTGSPPDLTVRPSSDVERWIIQGDQTVRDGSYWHGFITDGELVGG
jgi:hypothetical protein